MIRPVLACLVLSGFCLIAVPAIAAEKTPGPASKMHHLARKSTGKSVVKSAADGQGKRDARLGRHKHAVLAHSVLAGKGANHLPSADPVRRSDDASDLPLSDSTAPPKAGPASEFTVTPHMWLNFGVNGRL